MSMVVWLSLNISVYTSFKRTDCRNKQQESTEQAGRRQAASRELLRMEVLLCCPVDSFCTTVGKVHN